MRVPSGLICTPARSGLPKNTCRGISSGSAHATEEKVAASRAASRQTGENREIFMEESFGREKATAPRGPCTHGNRKHRGALKLPPKRSYRVEPDSLMPRARSGVKFRCRRT